MKNATKIFAAVLALSVPVTGAMAASAGDTVKKPKAVVLKPTEAKSTALKPTVPKPVALKSTAAKSTSGHEARLNWNSFASSSTQCDDFYKKWKSTGTGFWEGRYYACIHGW